jgi:hypothetical protein
MSQNNLNGLFLPAVAGLFFFMKRPKDKEIETVYPVYFGDPGGLTGVAKYLENQEAILLAARNAKLLEEQKSVSVVSGVAKYIQMCDQNPTSGVTKYVLRQALAEKQKKQIVGEVEVTGVEKYLKNKKEAPGLTGVAKYLKHQASLPQPSKVAKYMAKQAILSATQTKDVKQVVTQLEVTGVAKYLQHQASLPQPSRVAKYVAKQAVLAVLQGKQAVVEAEVTGVAKYLQHQASLPQPSKVAKYMAKQAAMATKQVKKPVVQLGLTGVAKYLEHQDELPQPSRVSKYMTRIALVEKQKPAVVETGVDKYVRYQG